MTVFCPICGVQFSSPVISFRHNDGESLWCPNGHVLRFREPAERALAEREAQAKREAEDAENYRQAEAWSVAALEELFAQKPTIRQQAADLVRTFRGRHSA